MRMWVVQLVVSLWILGEGWLLLLKEPGFHLPSQFTAGAILRSDFRLYSFG